MNRLGLTRLRANMSGLFTGLPSEKRVLSFSDPKEVDTTGLYNALKMPLAGALRDVLL